MAKKSEQQKIVDRIVRTLEPFSPKKQKRILKAAILLLEEDDDDDDAEIDLSEFGVDSDE